MLEPADEYLNYCPICGDPLDKNGFCENGCDNFVDDLFDDEFDYPLQDIRPGYDYIEDDEDLDEEW
jgi:hypothetical protein